MKLADYEVRCFRCNVSFPPGTRRCLHCGERTGAPVAPVGPADDLSQLPQLGEPIPGSIGPADLAGETGESAKKRPGRFVLGSIWLILAVGGSVYRACAGS